MPETEKKPIQFSIQNIEIVEATIYKPPIDPTVLTEPFTITLNLEQKIDPSGKVIAVILTSNITASRDSNLRLGAMTTACFFSIADFDSILKSDAGVYYIPPDL